MGARLDPVILGHARRLWDYHSVMILESRVDFILALGSHDLRVADAAADLWISGWAPLIVMSGGYGKVTKDVWHVTEAEKFAEVAFQKGVARDAILLEQRATNTGENITFSKALIESEGLRVERGLLVTKPYMCRRALATAAKQWPEIIWGVTAPQVSFDDYPNADVSAAKMINLMVGDLQRIKIYAELGFQTPQMIPPAVWESFEALRDAGYNEFVIRN